MILQEVSSQVKHKILFENCDLLKFWHIRSWFVVIETSIIVNSMCRTMVKRCQLLSTADYKFTSLNAIIAHTCSDVTEYFGIGVRKEFRPSLSSFLHFTVYHMCHPLDGSNRRVFLLKIGNCVNFFRFYFPSLFHSLFVYDRSYDFWSSCDWWWHTK